MVCSMLEDEDGLVLKKVSEGKVGSLASADIFIYNGVSMIDEESRDVYLVGKDYLHVYDE